MLEIIYLLPGQGSEIPGLGKKLLKNFSNSLKLLRITEEIWGNSLKDIILNEKEEIVEIKYSQPILCWYSYSLALKLMEKYKIKLLVPYSIGVFPAIALSEILPYEDVLRVLKYNYEKVRELNLVGKLLYVSGYPLREAKINLKNIYFSSINNKNSYTIGGRKEDIFKAIEFLKDKAFSLKILSSPWPIHTPLLKEISLLLEKEEKLWKSLKDGKIEILSPLDFKIVKKAKEGKFLLSNIISKTMFFNSVVKRLEREDKVFIEASESGFFQKIFKLHSRNFKILEGIKEI